MKRVLTNLNLRIKEFLFNKKEGSFIKKELAFPKDLKYPDECDFKFLKSDIDKKYCNNGLYIDILDFKAKKVIRYNMATIYYSRLIHIAKKVTSRKKFTKSDPFESYFNGHRIVPHMCHMTPTGFICASNTINIIYIDTNKDECSFLPEDYNKNLYLYNGSSDFSPDFKYWYFIRCCFKDYVKVINKEQKEMVYEICKLDLKEKKIETINTFNNAQVIHHVACCKNDRYLSFAAYPTAPKIPYPTVPLEKDINGYSKTHKEGIEKGEIIIYDMDSQKFMKSEVPDPQPGHTEFDRIDKNVFYLFCHNFLFNTINNKLSRVLEGNASILKYKIEENKFQLIDRYSDCDFYRLTQHSLFEKNDKSLLVVSTTPFRLSIVNTNEMKLDRRVKVAPYPLPDLSKTGNAIAPADAPLTINLSKNKRYLLLGWAHEYCIYDYETNDFLDLRFSIGRRGLGHTSDIES